MIRQSDSQGPDDEDLSTYGGEDEEGMSQEELDAEQDRPAEPDPGSVEVPDDDSTNPDSPPVRCVLPGGRR